MHTPKVLHKMWNDYWMLEIERENASFKQLIVQVS